MTQDGRRPPLDFSSYIGERTRDFRGREWVFQAVNRWLAEPQSTRFFLLIGEPGCGKTAIASRLSQFSQSVFAPPTEMKKLTSGFLSAIHFCSARDSLWVDPEMFISSIAAQLENRYGVYHQALTAPEETKIDIHIHQNVQYIQSHAVNTALLIEKLYLSGQTPQESFNRAVLEPLQRIYNAGFTHPITVLVDGLDESLIHEGRTTILALLSRLQTLPKQVRFILTARPDERVENAFLEAERFLLSAASNDQDNWKDISTYTSDRLRGDQRLARQAADLNRKQVTEIVETIARKAAGNFLYTTFLLKAIALGHRSLQDLEGLPEGLDALYFDSLDRVIKLGGKDWTKDYAPLLGALSVAQTGLTRLQLQAFTEQPESSIWTILGELQQFIERDETHERYGEEAEAGQTEGVYRLYHQSVSDFFCRSWIISEGRRLRNTYYLPAQEWHRHIARGCDKGGLNHFWEETDDPVERGRRAYARQHYAAHLYLAEDWEQLFSVLDESRYGLEKVRYDPSTYLYARDLDLGRQAAASKKWRMEEGIGKLPHLWRYSFLRYSLANRADTYPEEAFEAMALVGQARDAIRISEVLSQPEKRAEVLRRIAEHLLKEQGRKQEASQVLREATATGRSIENEAKKTDILCKIVRTLLAAGEREVAESVLTEAGEAAQAIVDKRQLAHALYEVANVLLVAGNQEEGVRLLADAKAAAWSIKGVKEKVCSLCDVARALLVAGHKEEAISLLTEVTMALSSTKTKDSSRLLEALIELVSALGAAGECKRAYNIARCVTQDPWMSEVLSVVAGALAQVGEWDGARTVMLAIPRGRMRVNAICQLATRMLMAGHKEEAEQLLSEGTALALRIKRSESEEPGAVSALLEVAKALETARAKEQALQLLTEAAEVVRNKNYREEEDLSQVVKALIAAGRIEEALQILREASPVAEADRESEDYVGFLSEMSKALAMAGAKEAAVQLLAQITETIRSAATLWLSAYQPTFLAKIVDILAEEGEWEKARRVAVTINDGKSKASALLSIARAFATTAPREKVLQLLKETEEAAKTTQTREVKAQLLFEIAETMTLVGSKEEAVRLITEAAEIVHPLLFQVESSRTRAKAIRDLLAAGERDKAMAFSISISEENAHILIEAARALTTLGEWDRAMAIAKFMRAPWKAQVLNGIVGAVTASGDWGKATLVAQSIRDKWWRATALREVAKALIVAGEEEKAQELLLEAIPLLATYKNDERKTRALCEIGTLLWGPGGQEKAAQILAEATLVAQSIQSIRKKEEKVRAIHEVARALFSVGSSREAVRLIMEATSIVRAFKYQYEKAETLRELGETLGNADEKEKAIQLLIEASTVAQTMTRNLSFWDNPTNRNGTKTLQMLRGSILYEVVKALAKLGELDRAIAVAQSIEYSSWKAFAMSELAKNLAKGGEQANAKSLLLCAAENLERAIFADEVGGVFSRNGRASGLILLSDEVGEVLFLNGPPLVIQVEERVLSKFVEAVADGKQEVLLRLFQHRWWQPNRRERLIDLLPAAVPLIRLQPEIGLAFADTFTWTEIFFGGKPPTFQRNRYKFKGTRFYLRYEYFE